MHTCICSVQEPYDPLYRESMIEHRQAMGRMHEKINDITTEIRYECY